MDGGGNHVGRDRVASLRAAVSALMSKVNNPREKQVILCYAEGCDPSWEAFCLSFDLTVQGRSFDEVKRKLENAIEGYLESVKELPPADQRRLLNRRAPISVWLTPLVKLFLTGYRKRDDRLRHEFTLPLKVAIA